MKHNVLLLFCLVVMIFTKASSGDKNTTSATSEADGETATFETYEADGYSATDETSEGDGETATNETSEGDGENEGETTSAEPSEDGDEANSTVFYGYDEALSQQQYPIDDYDIPSSWCLKDDNGTCPDAGTRYEFWSGGRQVECECVETVYTDDELECEIMCAG